MAQSQQTINVNGGLVTSKDPSLLADGELTQADNVYYKPNSPSLWKLLGRSVFNPTKSSGSITGLRYLEFDGTATDSLLIQVGGKSIKIAPGAATGALSDVVEESTVATTLDTVHYNNEHYYLRGVDRNRYVGTTNVSGGDATPGADTTFLHGMLANTTAPTADATAGTITLSADATITYWVEERVKAGSTIIKRNSATADQTVEVSGVVTNKDITITRPAVVNSDATHWALFATAAVDSVFPNGNEILEVPIATTTISESEAATPRTGTDPALAGAEQGGAYELSTVVLSSLVQSVARAGPPPVASTGDVFEDSLVLNDVSNKSIVRYSWVDEPHKFPAQNFIRFETKEQDEVRLIRTVGATNMICMKDSLWRINTLPRPEDAAFQTEKVREQVDNAFGCVGEMAGAGFSWGEGPRLAYVSVHGIVVTDGYLWDLLTEDLDWENAVNVEGLSPDSSIKYGGAVLINNPHRYRLELYCRSKDGGTDYNDVCYYLHYHPSHAKTTEEGDFRVKVTGPHSIEAVSAARVRVNGIPQIFTGRRNGTIYFEGNSDVDASGGSIAMVVRTKESYFSGVGGEDSVRKTWVHHSAGASGQEATFVLVGRMENESDDETTDSVSLKYREATMSVLEAQGESFIFGVDNSDDLGSFSVDYLVAIVDDLGTSESAGSGNG